MPSAHPPGDEAPFAPSDFLRGPARAAAVPAVHGTRHWLSLATVAGLAMLLALSAVVAAWPSLPARWQAGPDGALRLVASTDPRLTPYTGQRLVELSGAGHRLPVDAALAMAAPRWTPDGAARAALVDDRRALSEAMQAGPVGLRFEGGGEVLVAPRPLGWGGAGLLFWLLALPALGLALLGLRTWLLGPRPHTALFAVMAAGQAAALAWLATDLLRGPALLPALPADDLPWRLGPELAMAAAAVHLFAIHPVRLREATLVRAAAWGLAGAGLALAALGGGAGWWLGQGVVLALAAASIVVLQRSHRQQRHPFSAVLRRLAWVVVGALAMVQAAVVAATAVGSASTPPPYALIDLVVLVWTLFLASLLAWVPFLSRGRQLLPEFAVLGGLATVAASMHLLLSAGLGLDPVTAVTLAAGSALALYAAARRWLLRPLGGHGLLSTERAFEQLVEVARELVEHPEHHVGLLGRLLRQLFDPLEVRRVAHDAPAARVLDDGAALAVPVRSADERHEATGTSIVLRFARQGERLFTREDARLADRIAEQLARAAAYDRAVEHGRNEERLRIAQDLHDDIGARLLTLMYRTQDPEIEAYLRHTLQDLKTLTRGLAAREHRLSHASAEWKADLQHRLTTAHVELAWSFEADADPVLSMSQWSALTRILRELASNAMAHAQATRLDVSASLAGGRLWLRVADDGVGRSPEGWSHGLGLGGVRKRVKQLGGSVSWREGVPQGIVCEVRLVLQPAE